MSPAVIITCAGERRATADLAVIAVDEVAEHADASRSLSAM